MTPYVISFFLGILIYYLLRNTQKVTLIYCLLLIVTFIPTIPILFTYLHYTNHVIRDTFLVLFLSVSVAALIQKGWTQRFIVIAILLTFLIKGEFFGVYFPGRYDISEKETVKQFDINQYSITLERTAQPEPQNDIYHWTGKKYFLGNLLYAELTIDDTVNNDPCIRRLHINRVDDYEKGKVTQERIVTYDTCNSKVVSVESTNR
jgi:hypothetical protein